MARTTHELWLEDRQGVLDRCRDRTWWRWMHWCTSIGLLLAVVQWGWVGPSAVVLAGVAVSVLLFIACVGKVEVPQVRLVVDLTALAALAAVGAAGLVAVSATVGMLVVLVLTLTSPAVRRSLRDARTAFRLSLVLTREARRRPRSLP
ncbi:hypothetical protein [Nocardioides sp. zg-1230]|uniref:hypothetical protein n=1 Tax=Nocardioides sp. zg-1230 TaxID=2736601 RepID=UPI0015556F6D|nr:hypothetical protein [Nocardioides sp. zg-1230]NPC43670.1 hypothetical protein [Nocardioides sp. zg-1230]